MGKIAFLFPGQGSQAVGMGVALADKFPEARKVFDQASQVLDWDLYAACKEGPDDKLRQTDIAQPALYVTGYAAFAVLRGMGISPEAGAGHSIGEYAALAAANVFGFTEGLDLVRERARLMHAAAQAKPGGMAAVIGMERGALEALCKSIQDQHGVCTAVNFNSPEQIVVAGDKKAIDALAESGPKAGAKRVIPLNVSGAFHSPLMAGAATEMNQKLAHVSFRDAAWPVAMNVDGQCRTAAADIQTALAQQLDHSVEWVKSIESLKGVGCDVFVECGSGRVLSGLLRRIDKSLKAYGTETPEALEEVQTALAAARKGT